jgi:hypothetical protein
MAALTFTPSTFHFPGSHCLSPSRGGNSRCREVKELTQRYRPLWHLQKEHRSISAVKVVFPASVVCVGLVSSGRQNGGPGSCWVGWSLCFSWPGPKGFPWHYKIQLKSSVRTLGTRQARVSPLNPSKLPVLWKDGAETLPRADATAGSLFGG